MRVQVFVKPGSSQEKVVESVSEDGEKNLTIFTHARAHDGEANKKVIEILAKYFGVSKSSISLVRGATSRTKVFEF